MFERTLLLNRQLLNNRWLFTLLGVLVAVLGGWLIGNFGMTGALMTVGLPIGLLIVANILLEPKIGLLAYLNLSFLLGWARFIQSDFPLGLAMDSVLVLTLLSVFLNAKRMNWKRLRHPVYFAVVFWLLYTILELLNPEAPYKPAWFFHARAFSLNWFYMATIMLVVPITKEDIRLLIKIWLIWSFLAALWAFKQQYIGLEAAEIRWLAEGNDRTHVLWGQLRSFSFYSDASQFGAEMASATLICSIRFFEEKGVMRRIGYVFLTLIFFWAYAVSGTRSAFFVLVAGYPSYLFLRRDPALIFKGVMVALPLLVILLFTHLGDSVYQIYRIRTALRPSEDASFLVRLENQQKLRAYLKDLPFGAGIGTSADTGARFSPNHFAAQIPPDSWYVEIWIETGIVGLTLYLLMLATIIGYGVYKVWQIKDPWLFRLMIALLANFIGIALMCYSNPTLSQFPTCTMLYIASILFTTCERWDTVPEKIANKYNGLMTSVRN
ncbi:O-antigen ligase family protein [Spirosoma endbachense]|uniref:O-antigen ligase domain-containing protein n=1 Tax=Spirosoma endbachense TaxID=2666025 RepID=A0A6P1VU12_9BACT|nr:O-antigen ligase family protein [Spirosoma endbachense]QHV96573.1 O-antigen ligase domain-containing protein [Spirosoma endbachense]